MAHLLSLFTTLSLLLLFPSSSHAIAQALFSEPLQILFGGEKITDGDLTLSLSNKCSLVLYNAAGIQVKDFETTIDSTKHCALLVSTEGQLLLVPDNNEFIPNIKIGKKSHPGRYALLFVEGKLGIFGPAMWDNGVTLTTFPTSHHLKSGVTEYMLFSGDTVSGNANGDVVIAEIDRISAVITKSCTLAVKYNKKLTMWETEPKSPEPMACELSLRSNGELLLQRQDESGGVHTQWSNGFAGKEMPYVCLLKHNGQMLVYGLKTWLYHPTDAIKMVVT
ncbi:hypothetical protein J5N97_021225 [Dioscorea zingiberensis]|uniref:Bulb-type lectin domain-containing protein n=1 Tax=Dioscorea zingiberensis TaxID=325984 RepID=A0A9D5CH85_9LILI|nr:hypothetical protein J5N97_021225 [Dioscorea zingiberensis]